jgi:hypothetical protein
MKTRFLLALPVFAALLLPASAQHTGQDKDWIEHCVAQISGTNKSRAKTYCVCMAGTVDTSEKLRQTELERSFPPVHQECFRKAGFNVPN